MLILTLVLPGSVLAKQPAQTPGKANAANPALNIAWHYGAQPPLDTLKIFDVVVVDPGHQLDPVAFRKQAKEKSELFAYVSIGELDEGRPYGKEMPPDMLIGVNKVWNSRIIDQANPDWPRFFVDKIALPLWQRGYRGLFLDTMDSYHSTTTTEPARARQAAGLVKTIKLLRSELPGIRLISNRGFELLNELAGELEGVAAESLFGRWNQDSRSYGAVPEADRTWLQGQLQRAQSKGLAAYAIDYAPPGDRPRARQIARDILAAGFTPYVTNGSLTQTGIGAIEVAPRKVLMIHNGATGKGDHETSAHRIASLPLNYLGYRVELLDIDRATLPSGPLAGEWAGVVGIFEKDVANNKPALEQFLLRAFDQQVPLVFFNGFGVGLNNELTRRLGLEAPSATMKRPLKAELFDPKIAGYESEAIANPQATWIIAPQGSRRLLGTSDADGAINDLAAITPWGGFATTPFAYLGVPGSAGERWLIDPIEFYREAIGRGHQMPRADVSTETGKRLLLVHIDGDGFASRAEVPGTPFAAEIMYKDFIRRYSVPHTVSVIEGETSPQGLYPWSAPALEKIARDIFQLSHVEIASHSYSHPFFWWDAVENEIHGIKPTEKPHLPLSGYDFRLQRDVAGSASYIDRRLAPPGKRTEVFLWTGDCLPPWQAVKATQQAGLLNMNGGDTTINRAEPSLTLVAPFSIKHNGYLQVYAPNQNENVYTNDWTGPFYGFDKVIETFEMTENPRRLKPINIYYHTYSASKASSIRSLHKVYQYALQQPVNPVYSSEYIRKVIDFDSFVLARDLRPQTGNGVRWHYAGLGEMRSLRLAKPVVSQIDWAASPGLSGHADGPEGSYLHLNGARNSFLIGKKASAASVPLIQSTNGRIESFHREGNNATFRFKGHVSATIDIGHNPKCTVRAGQQKLQATSQTPTTHGNFIHAYRLNKAAAQQGQTLTVSCPAS